MGHLHVVLVTLALVDLPHGHCESLRILRKTSDSD